MAIGLYSRSYGTYSMAIGSDAQAFGGILPEESAIAFGSLSRAYGAGATAVGSWAVAYEKASAFGQNAQAYSYGSAFGQGAVAGGDYSTAIGSNASTTDNNSVAIGSDSKGGGLNSVAIGNGAEVVQQARNAIALGTSATSGDYGISIGNDSAASGNGGSAIALGAEATATGKSQSTAIAIGEKSTAIDAGVALGYGSKAMQDSAVAIGWGADTTGGASAVAIGDRAAATGINAVAIGGIANDGGSTASGVGSVAIGAGSQSTGKGSVAFGGLGTAGDGSKAQADFAVAIGAAAEATAAGAVAIGGDDADKAIASGINSLAFGAGSAATEEGGVAIGQGAQTTTANSVAIGMGSQAVAAAVGVTSVGVGNIQFGNIPTGNTGFAGDAPVGVISFGSAGNERQLVNVAAGRIDATSTDGVNGSQLFAAFSGINNVATTTASALGGGASVDADGSILAPTYTLGGTDYHNVGDALGYLGAQASLGWNLGVNGDPAVNIAPGASIDMSSSSDNLSVSQAANGNLTLGFSANPTFTSVTTGDTTINTNGLTIAGGPSITKSGVDAGGLAINNVAAGSLAAGSLQAVNGGQINALGASVASSLGGSSVFDAATGQVTAGLLVGGNSYTTVQAALNQLSAGSYAGWTLSAGGRNATIGSGDTVALTSSSPNLTIAQNTDGNVEFGFSDNPTFTSVTTGDTTIDTNGLTITGGPSITKSGVDAGGLAINNVAAGSLAIGSLQAVNGGQINALAGQIASIFSPTASINPVTGVVNAGLTVGGNSYGTVQAALDQISAGSYAGWTLSAGGRNATIASGDTVALTSNSSNLTIAQNTDGNVELSFSDNSTFTSVTAGDTTIDTNGLTIAGGPSITNAGIDGGGLAINNVGAGSLAAGSTQAVNGGQINTLGASIASSLGGTSSFNATTGQVTAGLNVGGANHDSVQSALDAISTVASSGWNLSTDSGTTDKVGPAATVNINGDGNISVTNTGTDVTVALNPDIAVDSVTAGNSSLDTNGLTVTDGAGNSTTVGADGLTIAGGPSVTQNGIDAGGTTVTNVGDGVIAQGSTDAVNGGQIWDLQQSINTANGGFEIGGNDGTGTIKPGETLQIVGGGTTAGTYSSDNIRTEVGADGTVTIQMADSARFGDVVVNAGGTGQISGVTAGTADSDVAVIGQIPMQYSDAAGNATPAIRSNDVTMVGATAGPVIIHNVAAGVAPTDAVNVSQLPGRWESPSSNTFVFSNSGAATPSAPVMLTNIAPGRITADSTDAVNGSQIYNLQAFTEQGLGRLESKVDANRDHASAGIASAISLGMIRYDDRPGKFSTGVGFGYHDGQAALGVGAGYTSEDQKWRLSAGGSYSPTNTKDSFSAGASATYTWN